MTKHNPPVTNTNSPQHSALIVQSARSYRSEARERGETADDKPPKVTGRGDTFNRKPQGSRTLQAEIGGIFPKSGSLDRNNRQTHQGLRYVRQKSQDMTSKSQSSGIMIGGIDNEHIPTPQKLNIRVQSSKQPVGSSQTKPRLILRPSTAAVQPPHRL